MMFVGGKKKFAENSIEKWRRIWLKGRNQDDRLQKAGPTTTKTTTTDRQTDRGEEGKGGVGEIG